MNASNCPIPLISEDDKRRNPHLAFPSLNKCNVVRATAAAIARGKRNLEGVLPSQRSTEIPGRSSGAAVLTVSPSFYLGRCESPLGNTESFLTSRCERHHCGCLPPRSFAKAVRSMGGRGRRTCSRFAVRSVAASPTGRRLQGQWRYGLNGRGHANSLTDYFVTEAPPTARKASCFRQPISARIALARPH